jgi:hypothetical protein
MKQLIGSGLTLAFIALVALMLAAAAGSAASGWITDRPPATLVLLLWQLAVELLESRRGQLGKQGSGTASGADRSSRRASAAVAWIGALLLLSWLTGVVAGATVFSLAWLRWHARERWGSSAAQAAALGLVLWLVFGQILGTGLYPGVLWPLLG